MNTHQATVSHASDFVQHSQEGWFLRICDGETRRARVLAKLQPTSRKQWKGKRQS